MYNKRKKHTVSASIDVNDRFAANNNFDYNSKKDAFDDMLSITSDIINDKLIKLVKNGEFIYDK